jgi:hypothetical protein
MRAAHTEHKGDACYRRVGHRRPVDNRPVARPRRVGCKTARRGANSDTTESTNEKAGAVTPTLFVTRRFERRAGMEFSFHN